jgi:hypothetical protein
MAVERRVSDERGIPAEAFKTSVRPENAVLAEIVALRQQLAVLRRSIRWPGLQTRDRVSWVWLSRWWSG